MNGQIISWLGQIPENWLKRRIKYIFQLRDERSYEALESVNLISVYTDKGVLQRADLECATGNKATNADGYKIVYKNDVVVNIMLCWMGAIGISDYEGVTSPAYDVYKIRPEVSINPKFYNYLFRTSMFSNECYRRGKGIMAMRWRVYSDQFTDITIPVPPKGTQDAVVKYLDEHCAQIDAFIEKKTKQIDLLEELKKSVITEAVLGRLVENRKLKKINSRWINLIPKDWNIEKLGHLFLHNTGKALKGSDNDGTLLEYITTSNLYWDSFDLTSTSKMYFKDSEIQRCKATKNDLLVCEGGDIGRAAIWPYDYDIMLQNHIHRLRPKTELCIRYYYYVLWFLKKSDYFTLAGKGIGLQGLSSNALHNIDVPFPSEPEQKEIVNFLDKKCSEINTMIDKINKEIDSIKDLRKRLICDAVTGKLVV